MPTIKQYFDDIRRIANHAGDVNDDDRLQRRQIQFWMNQYREIEAKKKAYEQNPLHPVIDSQLFQDMGCVPLCTVDQSECPDLPYGCTVLKTKYPVPAFVSIIDPYGNNRAIDFVGIINKRNRFYPTTASNVRNDLASRFGGSKTYFYQVGNNFYIATREDKNREIEWMNIRGLISDPTQVMYWKTVTDSCAFNWETDEYPMTQEMANSVKMAILTRELNISMHFIKDDTNDSADEK